MHNMLLPFTANVWEVWSCLKLLTLYFSDTLRMILYKHNKHFKMSKPEHSIKQENMQRISNARKSVNSENTLKFSLFPLAVTYVSHFWQVGKESQCAVYVVLLIKLPLVFSRIFIVIIFIALWVSPPLFIFVVLFSNYLKKHGKPMTLSLIHI